MIVRSIALVMIAALFVACDNGSNSPIPAIDLNDTNALLQHGEQLYTVAGGCADCHGDSGQGIDGPSLNFGPTAFDIYYQLQTNPEMAESADALQASQDDIVAIAAYVRTLAGLEVTSSTIQELSASMMNVNEGDEFRDNYRFSARDQLVDQIESFDTVIADWTRRANTGNIRSTYESRVARRYEAGEPKFVPEAGKVYFYEATGAGQQQGAFSGGAQQNTNSVQIVVGDAATKEVLAYYVFPPEMRAAVHTTAMSPDGRYVYVTGPRPDDAPNGGPPDPGGFLSPATIIKADALTLQPVEQLVVGGRIHHAQIFDDRLMLVDTFARDDDGLNVFLMDPETNEIIGGVRDEDLGGGVYTAFTDNEFIYILMEPGAYAPASGGYLAASRYNRGELTTMRPFWVAKLDPNTWEVVAEYPYPGFRANWIVIDSARENMFIPVGANSYLNKVNLATGDIVWTTSTGTGPYGASLNADESEIWVADKGETTGTIGRTMTVINAGRGNQLATVFSGYQVDHVLLAPNGREMWGSSNGDGRIYVFDAAAREQTHAIDMPNGGDAHGLVFVWYDENLQPHVVRDQGGFHAGINPALGNALEY